MPYIDKHPTFPTSFFANIRTAEMKSGAALQAAYHRSFFNQSKVRQDVGYAFYLVNPLDKGRPSTKLYCMDDFGNLFRLYTIPFCLKDCRTIL